LITPYCAENFKKTNTFTAFYAKLPSALRRCDYSFGSLERRVQLYRLGLPKHTGSRMLAALRFNVHKISSMKAALLAGTHSGCGKTTLTLALVQYFRQHRHDIVSFKAGPDFLDPLWHQAITGKPSYNLDTRMMGEAACRRQLGQLADRAEFALIEGVMGLFDGYSGVGGEGSSLDLARVVGCPVILVVDAGGMSGTIAIARDNACCFIYPANLDWLQSHGAKTVFFSPVAGERVPEEADAAWLPGGYPELHTERLSRSASWASLRDCADAGMPILAECGGAMLLGKALVDQNGRHWPMAGIFPYVSVMQSHLAALGYREEASGVKGHEFHFSTREQDEGLAPAFDVVTGDKGVRYRNVRASYVHWFFSDEQNQVAAWFEGSK
jgi:cobyrinic acid a,c-diamide synthase